LHRAAVVSWRIALSGAREASATAEQLERFWAEFRSRRAFGGWLARRQWKEHVRQMLPVVRSAVEFSLAARVLPCWRRVARLLRSGRAFGAERVRKRAGERLRAWRRASALQRLLSLRALAEQRLLQEGARACFARLVARHRALQTSMVALAARRPALLDALSEVLGRRAQDQVSALMDWHVWAVRRRRLAVHGRAAASAFRLLRSASALRALAAYRAASKLRASRLSLLHRFWSADVGALRGVALRSWISAVQELRRLRLGLEIADASHRRQVTQASLGRWRRLALRAKTCMAADRATTEARLRSCKMGAFQIWIAWRRRERFLRDTGQGLLEERLFRASVAAVAAWRAAVARALALSARRRLQVEERWRGICRLASTAAFAAWGAAARAARLAAEGARKRKAFACWRLLAQEQRLLKRYLRECSAAGFQGVSQGQHPAPGAVQPADFERLYAQLAAQRWEGDAGDGASSSGLAGQGLEEDDW